LVEVTESEAAGGLVKAFEMGHEYGPHEGVKVNLIYRCLGFMFHGPEQRSVGDTARDGGEAARKQGNVS
jgi:hypothetical protein